MGNLTSRVSICCGGDRRIKTDFCKTLDLIFKMSSVGSVLNGEEEILFMLISKIVRFIKFNPTVWEAEVKKDFVDRLLEMASDPRWGEKINLGAREALLELIFVIPPILKKIRKKGDWFDFKQADAILDLLGDQEDHRSKEACRTLHRSCRILHC